MVKIIGAKCGKLNHFIFHKFRGRNFFSIRSGVTKDSQDSLFNVLSTIPVYSILFVQALFISRSIKRNLFDRFPSDHRTVQFYFPPFCFPFFDFGELNLVILITSLRTARAWSSIHFTFLGHHLSSDGVSVEQDKVKCIREWPLPKCVRDIQSFVTATFF